MLLVIERRDAIPKFSSYDRICELSIAVPITDICPGSDITVCLACNRTENNRLLINFILNLLKLHSLGTEWNRMESTHFRSLSSSSNSSRYKEPHKQALLPRITITYVEVTTRYMPVPPPQSIECYVIHKIIWMFVKNVITIASVKIISYLHSFANILLLTAVLF